MSRTYRRKKKINTAEKYRWCAIEWRWMRFRFIAEIIHDTQSEYYKRNERLYHKEYNRQFGLHTILSKEVSKRRRRSYTRNMMKQVKALEDFEDFDFNTTIDKCILKQIYFDN